MVHAGVLILRSVLGAIPAWVFLNFTPVFISKNLSPMNYYSLLFVTIVCVTACKNESKVNDDLNVIDLTNEPVKEKILVSEVVKNCVYIPLDSTKEALIGEINKIVEYRERFYILDRFVTHGIFVFDASGNFLHKIGRSGDGPGGFAIPHDFLIDPAKNEILVLDAEAFRIQVYNLNDGHFKWSVPIGFGSRRFTKNGDYFAFVGGGEEANLIITDGKFNKIFSFFPVSARTSRAPLQPFVHVRDTLLLYHLNFTDTIFRIQKDRAKPYRRVEFGKLATTSSDWRRLHDATQIYDVVQSKKITCGSYLETGETIYFNYVYQKKFYIVIKSKTTGKIDVFSPTNVENDVTLEEHFFEPLSTNEKGEFITAFDPSFITLIESDSLNHGETYQSNLKRLKELMKHKNYPTILMKFNFQNTQG